MSTDTIAAAVDVFGDPPRNEQIVAYVAGDLPAVDLAGVIRSEAAAIAVLRQAADCGEVGRRGATSTFDAWRIVQLGIVDARGRMAAEPEEALDELLDLWSVGLDLGQAGAIVEVHVSAATTMAAGEAVLDLLASGDLDASALSAARARVEGLRQRRLDLDAARAREIRAYWGHLADNPRFVVDYARYKWSSPDLEDAARSQREAEALTGVVAAALARG